jgi:hypothetical protein
VSQLFPSSYFFSKPIIPTSYIRLSFRTINIEVPIEVVKKYAPAIFFHENERVYPCSIEHLLLGSTLKWRTWSVAQFVEDKNKKIQQTAVPAIAVFKGNV